jgi:hypothetical protein
MSGLTGHICPSLAFRAAKMIEITGLVFFLKLAPGLHVYTGMSVLRTMSLIVGAALVALGGSAVALFL